MHNLSEQEVIRRDKKSQLEEMGIAPYPSFSLESSTSPEHILKYYSSDNADAYKSVDIVGRVMSIRIMGSASFIELQYEKTKIQVYVARDSICTGDDKTLYNTVFKKLIDIGDIVGIHGYVFTTNVGVVSVHAEKFTLLSKSLKPLPIVKEVGEGLEKRTYDAFTDPEARHRQRYVDLIVNHHVSDIFIKRTQILKSIRNSLDSSGYLEVETPILQPIYGGAAARPFLTHHNALDLQLYLRISNELYLKRLIVGGYNGVYEFSKDFRNEGMSRFHNPEFTMLELYVAYKDYKWMMNKTEELIEQVALDTNNDTKVKIGENQINFARPWQRFTLYEAIEKFTGIDVSKMSEETLREVAHNLKVSVDSAAGRAKIVDEIFGAKCEPNLIQPTFITDYPVEMSPLAKKRADNPEIVERFEVICNGKEICNAYSELNDPIDQRKRFEEQLALANRGDLEAMILDEDFLNALEYGMPPTAGLGIGIDRLVMIMTNASSIQEVIFFPQMRPKKG
jgi:lysyl-tRNA synthetase class 2